MRFAALLVLVGCTSSPAPTMMPDATSLTCASTFGNELTNSFGRLDGTVLAIVAPDNQSCAQPNSTHVTVQVTMHGAAYRLVTNIDVLTAELDAPLAGTAWSEGWHTDAPLDYATTLHVASTAFAQTDVTARVTAALTPGARISVFSTSSGGTKADSAHLIHRNAANADGAIVVTPDTTPHYLLFRFANQTF